MPHYDFNYDHAFTLYGTLTTIHGGALQARITEAFPVHAHDDERACTVTLHAKGVDLYLRHDADVREETLIELVHTAAPDALGTLTLEWPYSELNEFAFPVDLRFQPGQVAVFAYEVRPCATPRQVLPLHANSQ